MSYHGSPAPGHAASSGLTRRELLVAIPATALTLGVSRCLPASLPAALPDERVIWQGYLAAAGTRETPAQNERLLSLVLYFQRTLPDVLTPEELGPIPPMASAVGVAALLVQAAGSDLPARIRAVRQMEAMVRLLMGTSLASLSDPLARDLLPKDFGAPAGAAVALRIKGERDRCLGKLRRFLALPVPQDRVARAARDLRAAQMAEKAAHLRDVLLALSAAIGQRVALDPEFDVASALGRHVVRRNAMQGLFRARLS